MALMNKYSKEEGTQLVVKWLLKLAPDNSTFSAMTVSSLL